MAVSACCAQESISGWKRHSRHGPSRPPTTLAPTSAVRGNPDMDGNGAKSPLVTRLGHRQLQDGGPSPSLEIILPAILLV
jgi:hypothetical protein